MTIIIVFIIMIIIIIINTGTYDLAYVNLFRRQIYGNVGGNAK